MPSLEQIRPGVYRARIPLVTSCTALACASTMVTDCERWTDWPECGGKFMYDDVCPEGAKENP